MRRMFLAWLGIGATLAAGCASMSKYDAGYSFPYGATRTDVTMIALSAIGHQPDDADPFDGLYNPLLIPLYILDTPISFVYDTITLPYDLLHIADVGKPIRGRKVTFPGRWDSITDPAGKYVLTMKQQQSKSSYLLLLRPANTTNDASLLEFAGSVDILWSPRIDFLAVTDYANCNRSKVRIFRTVRPQDRIDIPGGITAHLYQQPKVRGSYQVYSVAEFWSRPKALRFRIVANDKSGSQTFAGWYEYDVGKRSVTCYRPN